MNDQVEASIDMLARAYAHTGGSNVAFTALEDDVQHLLEDRLPGTQIPKIVVEYYVRKLASLIEDLREQF